MAKVNKMTCDGNSVAIYMGLHYDGMRMHSIDHVTDTLKKLAQKRDLAFDIIRTTFIYPDRNSDTRIGKEEPGVRIGVFNSPYSQKGRTYIELIKTAETICAFLLKKYKQSRIYMTVDVAVSVPAGRVANHTRTCFYTTAPTEKKPR